MYGTSAQGPRYLEMAEGYVWEIGLDGNDVIIGYLFVNLGRMMEVVNNGDDPAKALEAASGTYGRFADAVRTIDPRKE